MKIRNLVVVLLILVVLGTWGIVIPKNRSLKRKLKQREQQLGQRDQQLGQAKTELDRTKQLLGTAEQKLGYLRNYKTKVQVTGYSAPSESARFANGLSVDGAYAVKRTLPEGTVINVALSPLAQQRMQARFGDLIALMDGGGKKIVARFVDLTSVDELRPVVDIYFQDGTQAWNWGRKFNYWAVNLSGIHSPFRED